MNEDELIDGILIQLPLPTQFDTNKIITALNPLKTLMVFILNIPTILFRGLAAIQASLDEIDILIKKNQPVYFIILMFWGKLDGVNQKKRF